MFRNRLLLEVFLPSNKQTGIQFLVKKGTSL